MIPIKNCIICTAIFILYSLITVACYPQDIDINKIITIESSGNAYAHNKTSDARGLCQITPICLKDYNRIYGTFHTEEDLYNPIKNKVIGDAYINIVIPKYLKHYKLADTYENRLIAYHDGIGNLRKYLKGERKLGPEMKGYLVKYGKVLEKESVL